MALVENVPSLHCAVAPAGQLIDAVADGVGVGVGLALAMGAGLELVEGATLIPLLALGADESEGFGVTEAVGVGL